MADIFVCYRRKDSAGHAGRLVRDLGVKFPASRIFHDMDSLGPGDRFHEKIAEALNSSEVFLAVMGPHWRSSIHRLSEPGDFVRIEIETALERDIAIVPVLVGNAPVPTRDELPEGIADLVDLQVHEISDNRWDYDVEQLADKLAELPGLSSVRRRARRFFAGLSRWQYVPFMLVALVVLLAMLTRLTTGGELEGLPAELDTFDVDLRQLDAPEADRNCIKPLDCGTLTLAGTRLSEDIRLEGSEVYVDRAQQQLHVVLSVSWTLREGDSNFFHRGYKGKMYYVARYSRAVNSDRVRVVDFTLRDDSMAPFNGFFAFTFGWVDTGSIRDADETLTNVISARLNEAAATQSLP